MKNASFATAGISLRHVLATELRGGCPSDLRATSCTSDWRHVQPGDVYVAVIGDEDRAKSEEAVADRLRDAFRRVP